MMSQYVGENGREPPLDAARRPNAELEAADVDQHSLENIFMTAQMRPPLAPGVVDMGEGAFDSLAASPHQAALGEVGPNAHRVEVMAAFASKVVASMAVVRPFNKPAATSL